MKSCPTCNRTFEETFTFCLADGSLLNAPFDPHATLVIPEPRQTAQPTEVLKPEKEAEEEIPPTVASPQPEQKAEELVSTIAAPAPKGEFPPYAPAQASHKPSRLPLIMIGVGALLVMGLIYFIAVNRTRNTTDNSNRANTAATNTTRPTVATSSDSNQTSIAAATPNPTPSATVVTSLEGTVWRGTMSGEYTRIYEFKTGGRLIERSGAPRSDEASMETRIGSWTLQGNRVSMKFRETKSSYAEEIEATIQGDEMTGDVKEKGSDFHATIRVRIAR